MFAKKQSKTFSEFIPPRKTLSLDQSTLGGRTNISFGLPTDEAITLCRQIYKTDIAKLTIQITDPNVVQIKKDVKLTLADQVRNSVKILFLKTGTKFANMSLMLRIL